MKNYKFTAILAAALLAVSAVGCSSHKGSGTKSTPEESVAIGVEAPDVTITDVALGEKLNINETDFTLNSVIEVDNQEDAGKRYIYLDVTINNPTDTPYSLSTLNNFTLLLPDGTELYSSALTQTFAALKFSDEYYTTDPFDIPANGEFKGIIGGFIIEPDVTDFSVCFYATRDSENFKSQIAKVSVPADKIAAPFDGLLKPDDEQVPHIEYNAFVGQDKTVNSTTFKINNVYEIEPDDNPGKTYVFIDASIKDSSGKEYEVTSINNLLITLPGGTEDITAMRAQMYADRVLKENTFCFDPFTIPANGEFSGIIGGFVIDTGINDYKITFYPTLDSPESKNESIVVSVKPEDIKHFPDDMLK